MSAYSKHYGKLTFIAKGIRKPKSKKRGSLEVFSYIKFAAARGKGMDIMTEVELVDGFDKIRSSLKKVAVAYFMMEAVDKLTREEEKNLVLYSHILNNLKLLKHSTRLKLLREQYIKDLLVMLGYWPPGKKMTDPDGALEHVTEREMNSKRVGKKILQ